MMRIHALKSTLRARCWLPSASKSHLFPLNSVHHLSAIPSCKLRSCSLPPHVQHCFSTEAPPKKVVRILPDFFDEPVTSLGEVDPALFSALNDFILAVCTKGQASKGGGGQEGPTMKATHSSAKTWAALLQEIPNNNVPIAAVAAVGHVLVQANVGYLKSVDKLLAHTDCHKVQLLTIAQDAVAYKNDERLSYRERWHLQALDCLLRHERREALKILVMLLQRCPGDGLALSLAMDLASTLGDRETALTIAGSSAAYWQERRSAIVGSHIGLGIICVGLAAGGRWPEAERMTIQALHHGGGVMAGGTTTWALAHVMDAEGRVSEGISLLAGNEGMEVSEGSGLLFFGSRLAGYGARYVLDREEERGRTITTRIYNEYFGSILDYSGYAEKRPWGRPQKLAPSTFGESTTASVGSFFSGLFGGGPKVSPAREERPKFTTKYLDKDTEDVQPADVGTEVGKVATRAVSIEDVLCWLPPTPLLLSDATLTLFKQTLSQKVKPDDETWTNLKNAWLTMLSVNDTSLPPNSAVIASLLCDPDSICGLDGHAVEFAKGLHSMGALMGLAQTGQRNRVLSAEEKDQWKAVADLLVEGAGSLGFWELDLRLLTEKAVCHACLQAGDSQSLCTARAICSQSVTLRPNSPEEWMRYSKVLDALGDKIAAENARSASLSMGYGEGGLV
jgi:hypothetical protein